MKKNYFYNLSLAVTNILFPVLSFPYASRILGPEGIGKVQLASSFAQYFALFAALGIPIYGIQEVAKIRHNRLKLDTVFSELFSLVYAAVIFTVPYFSSGIEVYSYAGLIVLLGFSSIDWLYSGLEDFKSLAVRTIIVKLLALVFLYLFVKNANDYRNYLFVTIFSLVGNNLINVMMIRGKATLRLPSRQLLRHLKPLFYIFSTTIAASMYAVLDTVLLGFLSNELAVGLYTAAVKLCKVAIPFVTSISLILIPQISKNSEEGNKERVQDLLDTSFHFISFFSIPLGAGLLLLAPEVIIIFSGSKFHDAAASMRVLALLPLVIGFGYFFAFQVLVPGGRYREMFYSALIGVACCLILNFLLIPLYREMGTAITNVASELLVTVSYFLFVRKYFEYRFRWGLLSRALLCSASFLPVIWLVRSLSPDPLITLCVSVAVCAAIYFLLQYFLFRDKLLLKITSFVLAKLPLKNRRHS
jgi:O-antigen/teichoic acid export membrane protein